VQGNFERLGNDAMSEQTDKANEFARKHLGGEVDAAAAASGLSVLPGGKDAGSDDHGATPVWIELPGRGSRVLADFAKDAGHILSEAPIFRRENVLVTVDHETGMLNVMSPERFLSWINNYAIVYEEIDVGRGMNKTTMRLPKTMPLSVARGCLASDEFYYAIRPLARVNSVRMPVMRADGRVELLCEGYDEESQIFTRSGLLKFDETMSVEKSSQILRDYFSEFSWADVDIATGQSRSLAVAVCAMVALFGMGMQTVEASRMGFLYRANTQGGGKSLLAMMAISASFGLAENTPKASEDELRKVLDMAALQGASYLFFDNLKNHVESALLEGFMTSPVWAGRVMGSQRGFRAKKSTVLIITGNNLTVSPDLQRRMLQCDVFVEEFDLQEKQHRRDLNPVVLNRAEVRSEILSALWALVRHWDGAGRPKAGDPAKPYRVATFAEWSDIFGGIVQAAGFGNPLTKPRDDQAAARITVQQRQLVESLAAAVGVAQGQERKKHYDFQELVDCCHENEFFDWFMDGKEKRDDGGREWFEPSAKCRSKLGLFFSKEMAKRIFAMSDGRRVRFYVDGEGRSRRYVVEIVLAAAETPVRS
jgi:hypothetical protein